MKCHRDLIFFLLERAKCLLQKYIKEFDWEWFFKAIQGLEQENPKNSSATFLKLEKKSIIIGYDDRIGLTLFYCLDYVETL